MDSRAATQGRFNMTKKVIKIEKGYQNLFANN